MKKLLTITLLLFITIIANTQIMRAELTATGLTCSMCSKATYNQLISISEVEKVETDLNNTAFIISNFNANNKDDKILRNFYFSIRQKDIEDYINEYNKESKQENAIIKLFTKNNIF